MTSWEERMSTRSGGRHAAERLTAIQEQQAANDARAQRRADCLASLPPRLDDTHCGHGQTSEWYVAGDFFACLCCGGPASALTPVDRHEFLCSECAPTDPPAPRLA